MDKQMLGIINAGEENRKLKDLVRSRSLSALPDWLDVIVQLTFMLSNNG